MNDAGRIGFLIRGEYNNTETYDFLDVVYYGNSSYVAKKLTVGNPPADNNEYWQALAKVPGSTVLGVKGNAESTYRTGNVNLTAANIGLGNVNNTADTNKNVATANQVNGTYTGSGGQQSPSYVTSGKTRFNMWNAFKGITNPAGGYMDVILMDNYMGGDVPYVTGIGVTKNNGNPRMFIANGEKGGTSNWAHQVEVITSANISSQNVASSTKATKDGNGNVIADTYTKKDGSNVTGTWSNLTAGNAIKASQDSDGNIIKNSYTIRKEIDGGNFDNIHTTGIYRITNPINAPTSYDYWHLIVLGENSGYTQQIAMTETGRSIYFRSCSLGWSVWNKIYVEGDIGTKNAITDFIYPVGSIYMSVNSTSPATLFGGIWVRWGNGRIPVGIDTSQTEFNAVEKTGGEKTHTITTSEMPSHTHSVKAQTATTSTNGKHTHSGYSNQDIASGTSAKNRIVKGGDNTISGFLLENGDHSHTVTIPASTSGSTGSGVGHNDLPPYITCYMWKRTA